MTFPLLEVFGREPVRKIEVTIPDPDRPRRALRATVASLGAAGILWGSLFSDHIADVLGPTVEVDLDSGQGRLTSPAPPHNDPDADIVVPVDTTPTTEAPDEPDQNQNQNQAPEAAPDGDAEPDSASPSARPEQPGRPAGAYDEPDQAAQAWYAHRGDLPAEQVQVLQLDRVDHDTFTALVTAEKDARQHGALLEVVRVGGSYWQVSRLLQEG